MDEREVEFSLLEDLKMGEFDFNEGDDYETKVMGSELEKEVGESTINDQARRDARLEAEKQDMIKTIKEAEETAKRYSINNDAKLDILFTGIKKEISNIINNYDSKSGKIEGTLKTKIYDALLNIGIDRYTAEMNSSLRKIVLAKDQLGLDINNLERKLNNTTGKTIGMAVKLDKDKEVANGYGNSLVKSRGFYDSIGEEISNLERDKANLITQSSQNLEMDYSADIEYITLKIKDLSNERKGIKEDIEYMTDTLEYYDGLISTYEGDVMMQQNQYEKLKKIERRLKNKISRIDTLVDSQKGKEGIIVVAGKANRAVNYIRILDEMEDVLGNNSTDINRIINERINNIGSEEEKPYIKEHRKMANNNKQELSGRTDELMAKYATIPHKF